MGFIQKIRDFFNLSLKDPKAWNPSLWNHYGSISASGENVTEETALTYSALWNAIVLISGTIGSLPLHLMQRLQNGSRIADNSKLYRVMHDRWNPLITAKVGRQTITAHVLTWGNGYAEKVLNGFGEVIELWPIPPRNVIDIHMTENDLVYEIKIGNETKYLSRRNILHLHGLGFNGFAGYSVVAMARKSIGLAMAMETFGSNLFSQGMHPGAIIKHPNRVKDVKKMREALSETYAGLGKTHRLMLLEDGMNFEKVGIPPEDSQFIESRQFQIPEIARWFNLPPHKLKDLTKSSFCLPAEEEIYTQFGPKPISDVTVGDKVWSLNKNRWTLSTVQKSAMTGIDEILIIKTTNRTIRCNAKHPILCRIKNTTSWETKWIRAGNLNKGDTIVTLQNLPASLNIPKRCDGSEITVPFMEFCGLLIGDGNIIFQNGKPSYICIARSDNATYMDYYRKVINQLFFAGGYKYRSGSKHPMSRLTETQVDEIRQRAKNILTNMDIARKYKANICAIQNIIHKTYNYKHSCAHLNEHQVQEIKELLKNRETTASIAQDYGISRDLVVKILSRRLWAGNCNISKIRPIHIREYHNNTKFNSHLAAQELIDLGFGGTARTKRIPNWVFDAVDELKLAFLRGFLDADGSVDKNGRIVFSSCNKTLLSQIRHLCMGLGIPVTNLRMQEGITNLPNGKPKAFKQYSVTCSNSDQNRRIGSHTHEYVQRMENAKPFNKKNRNYPRFGGEGFSIDGCGLARIVSIDKSAIHQPVYDLSVNKTHSFIANGVVVHNSNIEQEQISFVTDSILPWLIDFEQEYHLQLLTDNQKYNLKLYFKHAVEGLLRADAKSRAQYYKIMKRESIMTPNECREKEDLDPYPDPLADELWVEANMMPIGNFNTSKSKPTLKPNLRQKTENILSETKTDILLRKAEHLLKIKKSY